MPKKSTDTENMTEEQRKERNKTHISRDTNAAFLLNLPKKLKEELEKEAEYESRSLTNYIIHILKKRKKPDM